MLSEKTLLEALIPSANYAGIHNYDTGQGASPSMFFFSENKLFLVKTLKNEEFDILFRDKFLIEYYKYMQANPESLLSRYFGVYKLTINHQTPVRLFITENIIGNDFEAVKRCYDLKGSSNNRLVKLDLYSQISGDTGLKVLKCENFVQDNKNQEVLEISQAEKDSLKLVLSKDSMFLKSHALIDYSVFLVEVAREKMLQGQSKKKNKRKAFRAVVHDAVQKQLVIKESKNISTSSNSLSRFIEKK